VGLITGLALTIAVVIWAGMTDWRQSAEGSAELRARVRTSLFVITDPRRYRPFAGARVEGPLLFHDRDGSPSYYKFFFRRDGRLIGDAHVDAQSLAFLRFGSSYEDPNDLSGCPQAFPDAAMPGEAMKRAQKILSQYLHATPDEPFLCGIGGPEWWLIEVRRDGEVLAWVTVSTWGGRVWELPAAYWDNPLSGW
jgi:hypothetical protein